jgi:hypothetical protein
VKHNDGSHDHDSHNGSSHDDIELEGARGKDDGRCLVIFIELMTKSAA